MAISIGKNHMTFRKQASYSPPWSYAATLIPAAVGGAFALVAAGGALLFLSVDLGSLVFIVAAFIDGLAILAIAISKNRMQRLGILLVLAGLWIASAAVVMNYQAASESARWMFFSNKYKNQVREAGVDDGPLRLIEWDAWGFFAQDTFVYLVFDPKDSLATPQNGDHGKVIVSGCEVWKVKRLDPNWYAVTFYTNTSWGVCT